MPTDYMLASDSGSTGLKIVTLDKVSYDEDYIRYFDVLIFSKELYEFYRQPRKLNSYLYQLKSGVRIELGSTVIVATGSSIFNWILMDHTYNTFGVPGIAMPVGAINADVFHKA